MPKKTPICRSLMLAFGGTLASVVLPAFAQQELQKVEITGSSIKRIDAEKAVPVQVITRDDIQRTGAVNVEQLLQVVSSATSSGAFAASAMSGATTGGLSSISLRGLSSLRTLVLLNGRRIAPYGIGFTGDAVSVDVNSIPLAAIDRVEVLKDGASSIYGSDAIAGVVNFILRKDFVGTEITGQYGDTSGGGAALTRVSATWGIGDLAKDRFNVMLVGSFQKEKALFGKDRTFAASGIREDTGVNGNFGNDTTSGNTFPANIAIPGFGTFNPSSPACPPPYAIFDPLLTTNACRFDPAPLVQLIPDTERVSLFGSARFAVTNEIEAYLEASFNRNRQNNIIQPVPISDQFALPDNHPLFNVAPYNGFSTIVLNSASPFYPTAYVQGVTGGATPDLLVRWRANASGNRNLTDISEAPRLAAGVKGTAMGWDFDAGYLHSQSRVTEQVNDGFPALSQILPILNSGNVNFFGPNSADVNAQLRATNFTGEAFRIRSSLDSLSAKGSRELMELGGGPLAVAIGAEYRKEKYQFLADPTIQTGDISGYGGNFLNTDRGRDVKAVFGEISVPILKGLEANASVRYDHYEGVGSSTTPKLTLKWQPTRGLLLRGSVGKGFRAPSLQDLYLQNTSGVTPPGLNDPIRCPTTGDAVKDCATQFPVLFGGNQNLKPEKSRSGTVGLVFEPTETVSIAVDYFKINLEDQINNGITAAVILGDLNKYGNLVTRGPVDPLFPGLPGPITLIDQTNINIGQIRLSGIDFDTKFRIPMGDIGRLTVGYSGTYFLKYDTQNPDGTFTPAINFVNAATGGVIPRLKTYLSATLARGAWNYTLAYNWQSSYEDLPGTLDATLLADGVTPDPTYKARRVGTYETFDGQVQYNGIKDIRLTVGIKNLFNRAPPYSNAGGQTSFQSGYDPQYADPRGRFVYGTVSYTF